MDLLCDAALCGGIYVLHAGQSRHLRVVSSEACLFACLSVFGLHLTVLSSQACAANGTSVHALKTHEANLVELVQLVVRLSVNLADTALCRVHCLQPFESEKQFASDQERDALLNAASAFFGVSPLMQAREKARLHRTS